MSTTFNVAERFKSVQGEGVYAGTPMAFIRFVGCSVGKRVCHHCDTDFDEVYHWKGGGTFTAEELVRWAETHKHICLTGGEPFDQPVYLFWSVAELRIPQLHIETSGTRTIDGRLDEENVWICVSPKPGYTPEALERADEIKLIVGGLGNGPGWPTLHDAIEWAEMWPNKPIFIQPRNKRNDVDYEQLGLCQDLVATYPQLRLSVQLHKLLRVR